MTRLFRAGSRQSHSFTIPFANLDREAGNVVRNKQNGKEDFAMDDHQINSRKRACLFGSLILVLTLLVGCATQISAIHDPLYRAVGHTSTITATASNDRVGIANVTITVTTGEMTDCTELGGPPSMIPCRQNATTVTHECNYTGGPSSVTCAYSQTLGNRAIVTYKAKAEPVSGSSRSTSEITYAGGYPPTAGIARPVWWHRDQPMAEKIDVGFFPDQDYVGDYMDFTDDVKKIALGVFFNSGQSFASTYTLYRPSFNLWAAPFGADADGCARSFDALVSPISAVLDGKAIVHKNYFRDCAAIALGGSGSVYAKAADADWIFVHESGHFLHGQGDEYCCDGGYGTSGDCANVFSSQAACQAAAPGHRANASNCVQIGTTGAWRNDDGSQETMDDKTDSSNWRDDSGYCVNQRFTNCGSGSCY